MRVCGRFVVVEHYSGYRPLRGSHCKSMTYAHRKVRMVYSQFKAKAWTFLCNVRGMHHIEKVKLWDPMRSIG